MIIYSSLSQTSRLLKALTRETVGGSVLASSSACDIRPSWTRAYLEIIIIIIIIITFITITHLLLGSTTTVPGLSSDSEARLVWN